LPIRLGIKRNLRLNILQVEHRAEQRREQLLEQRLVRLREQLAVQRRIDVEVKVEVQVEMERKTQLTMQVSTQPALHLPVLPDEQREVLRGTQPRPDREVSVAGHQVPVVRGQGGNYQASVENHLPGYLR
jgi:hypothetical protein